MNTKEKNVFQGFKMAVTHSQQCQSKFNKRAILRVSFLFCLFLWCIMAVYLPAAYSYSQTSPHWNQIRTQLTDFRTIYIADDVERASQYDWGASHYDVIMGDGVVRNDTVYEYKRRNPGLKWYAYATNWTFMLINADYVTTAWYIHMQNWYSNHPQYNIEDAFIHDANVCPQGTLKTEACRLQFFLWDSNRFVIYPADPGLQAYQAQRMSDIIAFNTYNGYEPDGVFFDEHASWDIDDARLRNYNIREYTGETNQPGAYMNDLVGLLQIEKNALGPNKLILINSGILTRESDFQMIMAAGSAFMELMNYPLIDGLSNRWDWVDRILSNGASATFSFPNFSIPANYTPGNSASGNARFELAALASHYMVVPNQPDNLTYQRDRLFVPFEQLWYTAIETEIGSPLGPRSIYTEGTDPNGWNYRVWARDFGNALVLVRPIAAWNYQTFDNTTGVTITLPSGDTYIPLNSDGTFGAPVSGSITLRNAEAAILIKQGSLSPTLQFSSATYDVSEAGTTATITVTRTASSAGAVTVGYATSNGTATTAGNDYTATSGTLSWADGDAASKTFTVSITNDTANESDETVNLTLSNPTGGAQLGSQSAAILTILNDDGTNTLQFSSSLYSVNENGITATIRVTRTNSSAGAISVSYATSNGTATAGIDYTAINNGTLNWADGVTAARTFTVSIANDTAVEGNETINLTLSNPTGGAQLGIRSTTRLTITDDDSNPDPNPNPNPNPDSNITTNSSAGDAEVSGGGCGFVKDDNGKGPRANGGAAAFAMMLIMTLAGIAVARRIQVKKRMVLS